MKILKKIGIGCIVLVICFCSCFKSINAFQNSFVLNSNGPVLQSYIGSFDFAIGYNGSSVYNDNISLQTNFYLPDTLNNSFLISSSRDYGVENNFIYDDLGFNYFVSQEIYFSEFGILSYQLHFTDIYVYLNDDNSLPNIIIDNGYTNIEQSYDFTYQATYMDTTDLYTQEVKENDPIQLTTEDNRYFTLPLRDLCKEIIERETVNSENTHGGLGLITELTITINMLDTLSSNYPTTIKLDNLRINEYTRDFAYEEFYYAFLNYETPGVFGWLINSIDAFMSAELFPNFSIGVLLGTIVAIPLLIYILRLFMGG